MALNNLQETVIKNGYCIGCGACSAVSDKYSIRLDNVGQYQAVYDESKEDNGLAEKVCPFSNESLNEDELSDIAFPKLERDPLLGKVGNSYFGHSNEFRAHGASGGLTTWFLQKILKEKIVDNVIHLKEEISENKEVLFKYSISKSVNDVLEGAKTKYFPGELSGIFKKILNEPEDKKYAIVGVPCFIKAARLLANSDPLFRRRVTVFVGLICGHYKTTQYAEMLAWQKGIRNESIRKFDFRHKPGHGNAGDYHTNIEYKQAEEYSTYSESVKKFYGTDWGMGLFKYNACDYCDDVVGETADVSFGDAWIEPYSKDHKGTNVVVVRSKAIQKLFETSNEKSEIFLKSANNEEVIKTQLGGFRHRREGLSLRLYWKKKFGKWVPTKRVDPSNNVSLKYWIIFRLRIVLSRSSHRSFRIAKKYNSFNLFVFLMFPSVFLYKHIIYRAAKIKLLLKRRFSNKS